MKPLRCLIADIPQIILADIVQRIVQENENIEVIERVTGIEDVPTILNDKTIDVLILGMDDSYPHAYKDIQRKFSDLLIIGLENDGRQATIYMDDVGCNEIVQAIKTLGKLSKKKNMS